MVAMRPRPRRGTTQAPCHREGLGPAAILSGWHCLGDEIAALPAAARNDICFVADGASLTLALDSVAAVSPCWASHFSLLAQRKVTKRKGTRRGRPLRGSPAALPCSGPGQSGSCRVGPDRDIVSRSPLRSPDRPAPATGRTATAVQPVGLSLFGPVGGNRTALRTQWPQRRAGLVAVASNESPGTSHVSRCRRRFRAKPMLTKQEHVSTKASLQWIRAQTARQDGQCRGVFAARTRTFPETSR